jgi:hypothetical protein
VIESEASTLRKQCKRDFSVRTRTILTAPAIALQQLARRSALAADIRTIKRKSTGVGSKNGCRSREDNLTARKAGADGPMHYPTNG